jgi:hypothetical protein
MPRGDALPLRFAAGVWLEADTIDSWWRSHRRASPNLFREELDAARSANQSTPLRGLKSQVGGPIEEDHRNWQLAGVYTPPLPIALQVSTQDSPDPHESHRAWSEQLSGIAQQVEGKLAQTFRGSGGM